MNETAKFLQESERLMGGEKANFPFPTLDKLSKDFYNKNHANSLLKKASFSMINTHKGIILNLGLEDAVLLSINPSGIDLLNKTYGLSLLPYIGGNGSNMYSSDERTYILSGKLEGKQIHLETTITQTQNYEMKRREGLCNCCSPVPVANGEPKTIIARKDNLPYWFITEPNKPKKD